MTDPLIDPHVDLTSFGWMPLHGKRLLNSDFNLICNDSEFRSGVNLWWSAWNQVPAGSLPSDDRSLCFLAGLGREIKKWTRVKKNALHGFILCSDSRFYHPILCEEAANAWLKKLAAKDRKERFLNGSRHVPERVPNASQNGSRHVPVVTVTVPLQETITTGLSSTTEHWSENNQKEIVNE